MADFVTVERAITCPRASVSVAAETAAQVLLAAGYRRGLGFGPSASYVRSYRPRWALLVAVVGALPTLGLSLLLLLYRAKDHCSVVIEDRPQGVIALVSGRVPLSLLSVVEAAGAPPPGPAAAAAPWGPPSAEADAVPDRPAPILLAPPRSRDHGQAHTPQAILRPAGDRAAHDGAADDRAADEREQEQPLVPAPVRPPSRLAPPIAPFEPAVPSVPPVVTAASTSGSVPWAIGAGAAEVTADSRATRAMPAVVPGRAAVLRTDTGEVLLLGSFCLLGREPVAREGDPPGTLLVRFADEKLSVSKTHLAYGVDPQGVWLADRNSTNGTFVIDASGRRRACEPEERIYVPVGCTVQLGQRRITVEDPNAAAAS